MQANMELVRELGQLDAGGLDAAAQLLVPNEAEADEPRTDGGVGAARGEGAQGFALGEGEEEMPV